MLNVRKMVVIGLSVFLLCSIALATPLGSSSFSYKYEADSLPTVAGYTFGNNNMPESEYASVNGGVLKLDSNTDGSDNDIGWYNMVGGAGTDWNPYPWGPFTIEVKMRSLPNNDTAYNAWFEWYDLNSVVRLQVWSDKVNFNGVVITGLDNSSAFHTFRVVSDEYGSSADQRFDLYIDGILKVDNADNYVNFTGKSFNFGDMTGYAESNIEIDYIRWDTTGAYTPIPEPATIILMGIAGLLLKRKLR